MPTIISESKPKVAETSEYNVIANWLSIMGVNTYRVRVSEHYYPYQLKSIVGRQLWLRSYLNK